MTDTVLANAQKKRDSIAAEINSFAQRAEEMKRELAKLDAWIAQWHEFAISVTEAGDSASIAMTVEQPGTESAAEPKRRRAVGNPKKEDVAEAAWQIIRERGEPVSRADLFKALAERGIVISSESDPEMVLSTMLWRMRDRIARLKTGGYWIAELPYEPAGFDPLDHFDNTLEVEKERRVQVDAFE